MEKKFLLFALLMAGLVACTSNAQRAREEASQEVVQAEAQADKAPQAASTFQNVDVEGFKELMKQPDVVILDVRTPQEVAQGAVQAAVNINLYDPDFDAKLEQLDKDKTYLVYCRSGRRSVTAANKMLEKGFRKVYNLVGGYNAWSAAAHQ